MRWCACLPAVTPGTPLPTPCRVASYPVLVDPQGQGRLWLMNREEANQLRVSQLNDKMFRTHLEDCLAFGKVHAGACDTALRCVSDALRCCPPCAHVTHAPACGVAR